MRLIFREFVNGKFHYWGFVEEGIFKGPVTPSLLRGFHSQYTNLKDMHDKEIYQGDIVRILYTDWPSKSDDSITLEQHKKNKSEIGEVVWNDSEWSIAIYSKKYKDFFAGTINPGEHGEIEVIGNRYENPDLLSPPN